jgi:hypothetical protein
LFSRRSLSIPASFSVAMLYESTARSRFASSPWIWAMTSCACASFEETEPGSACSGAAAKRAVATTIENVSACLRKPEDMRFPAMTGAPERGRYVTSTAP